MASTSKFSYQKLIHEGGFDGEDDDNQIRERVIGRAKSWSRIRNKVHVRRRLRVRIPSLRRFFRRKAKVFMLNWGKVVKRFKESEAHFGDLFAGNYLFMQVTPTPLKYVDKSLKGTYDFHGVSSRYSVPRISH